MRYMAQLMNEFEVRAIVMRRMQCRKIPVIFNASKAEHLIDMTRKSI